MNRPPDPKRGRSANANPGPGPGSGPGSEASRGSDRRVVASVSRSEEDEARSSSKYRAALEALFAPKKAPASEPPPPPERSSVKMIQVAPKDDPRRDEREKRLAKLLGAEGRAAVTKAADDFANAGFDLPEEQEVMLKLLDHARDDRVRDALTSLTRLLEDASPQRRPLLDARLRRLEDDGDDADVRTLAGALRRKIAARR